MRWKGAKSTPPPPLAASSGSLVGPPSAMVGGAAAAQLPKPESGCQRPPLDPHVLFPGLLPRSTEAERVAFLALLLDDLHVHPRAADPRASASAILRRIREQPVAEGVSVIALLSRPGNGLAGAIQQLLGELQRVTERRAHLRQELGALDAIAEKFGR